MLDNNLWAKYGIKLSDIALRRLSELLLNKANFLYTQNGLKGKKKNWIMKPRPFPSLPKRTYAIQELKITNFPVHGSKLETAKRAHALLKRWNPYTIKVIQGFPCTYFKFPSIDDKLKAVYRLESLRTFYMLQWKIWNKHPTHLLVYNLNQFSHEDFANLGDVFEPFGGIETHPGHFKEKSNFLFVQFNNYMAEKTKSYFQSCDYQGTTIENHVYYLKVEVSKGKKRPNRELSLSPSVLNYLSRYNENGLPRERAPKNRVLPVSVPEDPYLKQHGLCTVSDIMENENAEANETDVLAEKVSSELPSNSKVYSDE
jgi:hypothetical protein